MDYSDTPSFSWYFTSFFERKDKTSTKKKHYRKGLCVRYRVLIHRRGFSCWQPTKLCFVARLQLQPLRFLQKISPICFSSVICLQLLSTCKIKEGKTRARWSHFLVWKHTFGKKSDVSAERLQHVQVFQSGIRWALTNKLQKMQCERRRTAEK